MRLLVIHHSRDINSNQVYLSDDYLLANSILYGAQELDTWAGVRLFGRKHDVWRLQVCPNYNLLSLVDSDGLVVEKLAIPSHSRVGKLGDPGFLRSLLKWGDTSIAQYGTTSIRSAFSEIFKKYDFDKVWVETQFYEAAIPSSVPHIVRSVNFEPYHALTESSGIARYLRALTRLFSERRVFMHNKGSAISPLDCDRYSMVGIRQMSCIPLRQLAFISELSVSPINQSKTFLVIGSTYEVRHNKLNLLYVLNELAPRILQVDKNIKFQIFGNRLPEGVTLPENCEYRGFDPDLQSRIIGSSGVIVPFNGGAGMQSKVFEPLCLGGIVIANPKSLVGYPFVADKHYLSATTTQEIVEVILKITSQPDISQSISACAKEFSQSIFNLEGMIELLECALQD